MVKSGEMEAETRSGFVAAAKELGRDVDDPEQFLKDEQEAVFAHFQGK